MAEPSHQENRAVLAPLSVRPPDGVRWETWGAARHGARVVLTTGQILTLVLLLALGAALIGWQPRDGLIAIITFISALYFVTGMHKIWLLARGEKASGGPTSAALPAVTAGELPFYTVLVPLFHEDKMLPVLVERLTLIDYPPGRLEVLLLIEADDQQTQRAVSREPLPVHIRPLLMPPGQPRTKPRALNIALEQARGEFIVVYDAEDEPEPGQLRQAVAAMRTLPAEVVCLQARLNFYNQHQSALTRLFTVDYTVWYNQFLPGLTSGLARPGVFVPLGGTSNHFRVAKLRSIGGWDPFNVTEDCDLGVRLGRAGLRVAMLDSTTWEEAVTRGGPWIRQRSRWVKGYIQTYLVHMRRPLRLLRELGPRGFADFQMLVGASSFLLLANPLMWGLTALYIGSKGTGAGDFIQSLFPPPVYYLALLSLLSWNFIFFYCNVYVCARHGFAALTRYTLLTPFYWVMMSLGAWAGLVSLIRRPFYWAKTEHGASLPASDAYAVTAGSRAG